MKTDDGNHMEGKNNPVQHKPSGASLSDLRNQRDPYRPLPSTGDMKNSSNTSGQDNRILPDKIRALKERIHLIPEEVPETEDVNQTSRKGN